MYILMVRLKIKKDKVNLEDKQHNFLDLPTIGIETVKNCYTQYTVDYRIIDTIQLNQTQINKN